MTTPSRPNGRDWFNGIVAGVALGAVFLGLGGRAGMRIIAIVNDQAPLFSVEGSIAVLLLGAGTGAVIAAIFLAARTLFPRYRSLRAAFFVLATAALVLRGLKPLSYASVTVFGPLFLLFGVLLQLYWCRIHLRRREVVPGA